MDGFRRVRLLKDCVDKFGMTIPKDSIVFIEKIIYNPRTEKLEFYVRIDKGSGIPNLFSKTIIEENNIVIEDAS